jgi:predicted amino acid racemase
MERKALEINSPIIRVVAFKRPMMLIANAKYHLEKYEKIELHSLGQAMGNACQVAETLERFGYAKIEKIDIQQAKVSGNGREFSKPKMVIHLTRLPKFKELMGKFNDVRKVNEESRKKINA